MSYPDAPQPANPRPHTSAKLLAEAAGTFLLVFALTGTATFSAFFGVEPSNPLGVGFLGVALALGLAVMIGAYAFGPISGGHFNPAVTLGLAAARRFAWREVPAYIAVQLVGAIAGAAAVLAIASGGPLGYLERTLADGFASNGYAELSPNLFSLFSVVIVEVVVTALFLFVILGVTHARANAGFAPIAIGLTLTVLLLVAIPIDNASLNPARSLATALFAGTPWLVQLWVFLVFPSLGGLIAGFVYATLFDRETTAPDGAATVGRLEAAAAQPSNSAEPAASAPVPAAAPGAPVASAPRQASATSQAPPPVQTPAAAQPSVSTAAPQAPPAAAPAPSPTIHPGTAYGSTPPSGTKR
jgi:aquaporin Z